MQIGYIRVSKSDGSQVLDLQRDAMLGLPDLRANVRGTLIFLDLFCDDVACRVQSHGLQAD
jgi:hypothetical protein